MRRRLNKVWRFLRGHLWLTALGVVLLVLGVAFFGINSWAAGRYQQAQKAIFEEKYEEARACLQDCLGVRWWQTADAYLLAARVERLLGNYPGAGGYLTQSVQQRGQVNEATQLEDALLRAETGTLGPVEDQLWGLVKKNHPEAPQALRTLARVYLKQWRLLPAMGALNAWIGLKPKSGEALEWRGQMWERGFNNFDAEQDFRSALKVAPHRPQARLSLVLVLIRTNGSAKEISEHLEHLLTRDPDRPDYLLALARFQLLRGEFPEARELLDRVARDDPKNAAALLCRAELEYQAGQFAAAEGWARKAVAQAPADPQAHLVLAESLKRQNDPTKDLEARGEEEKHLKLKEDGKKLVELLTNPDYAKKEGDPDFLAEIGKLLLDTGRDEASLVWLGQALSRDPDHQVTHGVLAQYYQKSHQSEKAAEHLKKAKQSPSE